MATINLREIDLHLRWRKSDPDNLTYEIRAVGMMTDDSEEGGEKLVKARSAQANTITRADFRALTGAEIETDTKTKATNRLQAKGSGAGGHTVNDDTGN